MDKTAGRIADGQIRGRETVAGVRTAWATGASTAGAGEATGARLAADRASGRKRRATGDFRALDRAVSPVRAAGDLAGGDLAEEDPAADAARRSGKRWRGKGFYSR